MIFNHSIDWNFGSFNERYVVKSTLVSIDFINKLINVIINKQCLYFLNLLMQPWNLILYLKTQYLNIFKNIIFCEFSKNRNLYAV